MQERIIQSLLVLSLTVVAYFLPYGVGSLVNRKLFKRPNDGDDWLIGVFVVWGITIAIGLIYVYVHWVIYGN